MVMNLIGSEVSYILKKTCSKEVDWSLNGQEIIAIVGKQMQV